MKNKKKKSRRTLFLPKESLAFSKTLYRIVASVSVILLSMLLIATVLNLPSLGRVSNPDNNEVSQRYIEKGLEETVKWFINPENLKKYKADIYNV